MQHVENRVEKLPLCRQKSGQNFEKLKYFLRKHVQNFTKSGIIKIRVGIEILLGAGGVRMYLHLGQDVVVPTHSILGIYDMDTATWSKHTRALIASMEKAEIGRAHV